MLQYGVIGFGYWGPNLVRVLSTAERSMVKYVCEARDHRRELVAKMYPMAKVITDYRELLEDPDVDVVAIATPVSTHSRLAVEALEAGKHVFVEKPLAATVEEASHILEKAQAANRTVFVDHTFVYTEAVRKIANLIDNQELGELLYYDSTRVNLGLFQHDVNVIWDLVVHDIAILDRISPNPPTSVMAITSSPIPNQHESIAYVTLFYEKNFIAHIHASWLSPVKIRRTLIGGTRRMIVYDDLEPSEKIKIYDKGVELVHDPAASYALQVGYRSGDMVSPMINPYEALATAVSHANASFLEGVQPITSGNTGYQVVRILEAANQSAQQGGRRIDLA